MAACAPAQTHKLGLQKEEEEQGGVSCSAPPPSPFPGAGVVGPEDLTAFRPRQHELVGRSLEATQEGEMKAMGARAGRRSD